MEEQIYINGVLMEQSPNKSVSLVFQSPFFTDIDSIVSNRSNSVDFPATENNLQAIDNAHLSGSTSLYQYRYHHVVYCRDGIQIFTGRATLLSLTPSALKFSFVWGNANAFQKLFETNLHDLQGESDYVDWTAANIASNPHFCYPSLRFGVGDHPIMAVSDILERITSVTGVAINNSSLFSDYAIPLLTKNADDYAKAAQGVLITTGATRQYAPTRNSESVRHFAHSILLPNASDSDLQSLHAGSGLYCVSDIDKLTVSISAGMVFRCPRSSGVSMYGGICIYACDEDGDNILNIANIYATMAQIETNYIVYQIATDSSIDINVSSYSHIIISLCRYYNQSALPKEDPSYAALAATLTSIPSFSIVADSDKDQLVAFGGKFPLYLNLPDWDCSTLLKNLMKIKGVFPYCTDDSTIEFVSIDNLYSGRASAYDCTDKLILPNIQPNEQLSTLNSYGQINHCKYAADETVTKSFNGSIIVDNDTLDKERDLITLDFAATDNDNIRVYSMTRDENGVMTIEYNESIVPRILRYTGDTNNAGQRIVTFDGLDWKSLIQSNYATYQTTIQHPRVIKADIILLPNEIASIDLTKPIYSYVLGHYYAVSKLTTKAYNVAEVELVRLGSTSDDTARASSDEEFLVVTAGSANNSFVTSLPSRSATEQAAITASDDYKVCLLRYGYTRRGKAGTKTDKTGRTVGTHTTRDKTYKRYRRGLTYRIIGEELLTRGSFSAHSQTTAKYSSHTLVMPLGTTISLPGCRPRTLTRAGRVSNKASVGLNELWVALYHRNSRGKWECISNKVQVRGITDGHTAVWDFEQSNIVLGSI